MLKKLIPLLFLAMLAVARPAQACSLQFTQELFGLNLPSLPPGLSSPALERLPVQVKNVGSESCAFKLGIARENLGGVDVFPPTQISAPFGPIYLADLVPASSATAATNTSSHTLSAGETLTIIYRFAVRADWNSKAGDYYEELVLTVYDDQTNEALDTARAQVFLGVPPSTNIRFVGNSKRLDLGTISPNGVTRSPPFGIRVFSTSPYKLTVTSTNGGVLTNSAASAEIDYRMDLDGQAVDLGTGEERFYSEPTGNLGKVMQVRVTVGPQPNKPAGTYRDLITVSVTPS